MDVKRRVAISSVIAALFLTGTKLTVGLLTGSLGILSEAAHSGLDLLAAGMTWWAVHVSDRPPDADHPYGHEKIENISALFETLLLLVTCVWIISEAVHRLFFRPVQIEVNAWSYGVVVLAIVIDLSRSTALSRVAKRTRSAALEADALHFSSDIFSSLVVLVGLASTQLGYPQADAIAALGVSAFVIWISVRLGKRAVQALTDWVPEDHVERAARTALTVPGVRRAYDVRVRQAGAKHFLDLKVAVDRGTSFTDAHRITEAVEEALREAFKEADVLVHAEPDERQPAGLTEEIFRLSAAAGASAHALQINRTDGGLEVQMHLEWPCDKDFTEAHKSATRVEESLRRSFPAIRILQTHLECPRSQAPERVEVTGDHPDIVRSVREAALSEKGVTACRKVHLLEGEGRWWLSVTCVIPPHQTLHQAHHQATRIEERVRAVSDRIAAVSVHTEPGEM
ncbi:MAG: cation diffusion facilitator family transporter [Acidobacteriota bacterium]